MRLNLLLITLLLSTQTGHADSTLVFTLPGNSMSENHLTYYIKEGRLRIKESGNRKINVFDQEKQEFTSFDPDTGNISRINSDIIKQHLEKLNKQRLDRLKAIEKDLSQKLETMTTEKKEIAEVLINKLRYPEFYGDHTFLKSSKTSNIKKINDIECQVYNVNLNQKLVRQICMTSADKTKMKNNDYQTLRSFYKFNYDVQSQMSLAAGKTSFTYIDYEQHEIPGIPAEISVFNEQGSQLEQVLDKISHEPVDKTLFDIKKQ